jgi:hypothetical protein
VEKKNFSAVQNIAFCDRGKTLHKGSHSLADNFVVPYYSRGWGSVFRILHLE